MKSITVIGRRWFDKTYGNTYCAAKVLIDGKHVLTTDWEYGYDDFYLQLAEEKLRKAGIVETKEYSNGMTESLRNFCADNGIEFFTEVSDGLKRDLVAFSKEKPND